VAAEPYAYLTTRGRRTGRAHRIELWFVVRRGAVYFTAGGRDRADWGRNLRPATGPGGASALRGALLVSHGGVTVDLLRSLFGDDAVRAAAPGTIERNIPSCGIIRLARRGGPWELLTVADVLHLAADRTDWRAS
jgi:hypothetical protein